MTSQFQWIQLRAAIARLAYESDGIVSPTTVATICKQISCCRSASSAYELGRLVQATTDAASDYPQRAAPFGVLAALITELSNCPANKYALVPTARSLQTLLRILEDGRNTGTVPSYKIFDALQSCILLLNTRLKVPAVDGIVSGCLGALRQENIDFRVGAFSTLAALGNTLLRQPSKVTIPKSSRVFGDFLNLIILTAQRYARFDPSEKVRKAAGKVSALADSSGLAYEPSQHLNEENECATYQEPDIFSEDVAPTMTIPVSCNAALNPLEPLAPAPAPLDYDGPSQAPQIQGEIQGDQEQHSSSTPSVASCHAPSGFGQGADVFSSLGSDLQSVDSVMEIEVEDFLRGSILPGEWMINTAMEQLSSPPDDVEFKESENEKDLADYIDLVKAALKEYYYGGDSEIADVSSWMLSSLNPSVEDINGILRICLDLHSEQAYDEYVVKAEEALVRASKCLRGDSDASTELERHAKTLEKKVHMAVAKKQTQFMETIIPQLADALANPALIEELLLTAP